MKRPLLIGIGASNSGAGKTTLACAVLEHYTRRAAAPAGTRWGAVKYTRTSATPSVVTDRAIIEEPGKDTARLCASGASRVVWVRSSRAGLPTVLPAALKRLSSCEVIVVEGNGAIEFLKPDIVLFIFGKNSKDWKPGIGRISSAADIVLCDGDRLLPEGVTHLRPFQASLPDGRERQRFFRALTGLLNERNREGRNDQKDGGGKAPLRRCPQAR